MKFKSKYLVEPRKLGRRGKLGHSIEVKISARWAIRNEYTRRKKFMDSSKTRGINYFHRTRVHIYQVWTGVADNRSGNSGILERHYQSKPEKYKLCAQETHVVEQVEAVASLSFGGRNVDSEAEGKIEKRQ